MNSENGIACSGGLDTATWDVAAFEALFRAHYAGLCGFVNRLVRSRAAAEELVQDLFACLWAQRDRLEVHTSVRAYLYRGARNRALNWLEHEGVTRDWARRERAALPQGGPEAIPGPSCALPDARLEHAELRRRVERALGALPERCRLVVRLRFLEQLSHAEIAEAMGISRKGVENQLGRGLKVLRELLAGEDRR